MRGVNPVIAMLDGFHSDPFDRMILATALTEDVPVLTRDRQFRRYKMIQVIG
jgi:PIN domain nuclease of toxin-antitoxin system